MSATRKNATPADVLADALVARSLTSATNFRDRAAIERDVDRPWGAFALEQMARGEVRAARDIFTVANAYRAERAA